MWRRSKSLPFNIGIKWWMHHSDGENSEVGFRDKGLPRAVLEMEMWTGTVFGNGASPRVFIPLLAA